MDKKYLRKVLLVVAVMAIVTVLIFSTVNFYFASPESEVVTRFPTTETFDLCVECPTYVIRNEQVIDYDISDHSVLYFYESGERVSKGSTLAYVYDGQDSVDTINQIYATKELIKHFESIISAYDMYTLEELNREIFKLTNKINLCISSNDTTELEKLESKLLLFVGVRDIKIGSGISIAKCHQKIDDLNTRIDELISSMGDSYEVIKASMSGYFIAIAH